MRSKILISIVLLLISTYSMAAVFPTGPSITIGGQVTTGNSTADQSLTGNGSLISLIAATTGATNRYSGLVKLGATTAYTPSGSKAFVSTGVRIYWGSGANLPFYFSSCDASLGTAGTVAPTNPVYLGSGASGNINAELGFNAPGSGTTTPTEISGGVVRIPNGKFGCVDNGGNAGSATALIYGYEQ